MDAPRSSFTNPRRPSPARVGFKIGAPDETAGDDDRPTQAHRRSLEIWGLRLQHQESCGSARMQSWSHTGQHHGAVTHTRSWQPSTQLYGSQKQLSNSQQNKRLYMTEITQDPASIPPTLCHFPPSQLFVCTPFPTEPASPSDSLVRISCCVSGLDSSSASYPPRSVVAT